MLHAICIAFAVCFLLERLFPSWLAGAARSNVAVAFQRPEMHRIHHRFGMHRNNYGDITWWDMLFGTYENPAQWFMHAGSRTRGSSAWSRCWRTRTCTPERTPECRPADRSSIGAAAPLRHT